MSTFVSFGTPTPEDGEFFDIAGSRMNGIVRVCVGESSAFFNIENGKGLLTALAEAIAYAEEE